MKKFEFTTIVRGVGVEICRGTSWAKTRIEIAAKYRVHESDVEIVAVDPL